MPYDIFISYAHHDNAAHGRWVEHFHDRLAADYRSRTGKTLQIFLDREGLNAGHVLSDRLKGALNESTVFIPILSPAYLASEWCRREFFHFMEQAGEDLILDGSCRIVPVQLMPYAHFEGDNPEDQAEAARITGFLDEKGILYADFHKRPMPFRPDDPVFQDKIAALSEDVFDLLKTVRQATQAQAVAAPAGDKAIFLAYAAGSAKTLREGLLKELQQQRKYKKIDYRILPDEAPDAPADPKALSAAEMEAFTRRQLRDAIFSIHLFDDLEGIKTPDTREPVAHLQYRTAKAEVAERPGFSVFTAESITEDCSAQQEDFLEGVAGDARQMPQAEALPAFEVKAIKDYLLDKIKLLEEKAVRTAEAPPATAPRRTFFIYDYRDKDDPIRNRIDDLIYEQQYDVYGSVFREDDPYIDPDATFRDFWLVCNKALVLLRNASTAWCNAMKVELIKTAAEKQPPYGMAICVTEPDVARRIREVRSHDEFRIIDCTQEGYEQRIVEFLNVQRHA